MALITELAKKGTLLSGGLMSLYNKGGGKDPSGSIIGSSSGSGNPYKLESQNYRRLAGSSAKKAGGRVDFTPTDSFLNSPIYVEDPETMEKAKKGLLPSQWGRLIPLYNTGGGKDPSGSIIGSSSGSGVSKEGLGNWGSILGSVIAAIGGSLSSDSYANVGPAAGLNVLESLEKSRIKDEELALEEQKLSLDAARIMSGGSEKEEVTVGRWSPKEAKEAAKVIAKANGLYKNEEDIITEALMKGELAIMAEPSMAWGLANAFTPGRSASRHVDLPIKKTTKVGQTEKIPY